MADPAPLRGHHLICLHFFKGEGYSAEFVEALEDTMERVDEAGCVVVEGRDAVCAACPSLGPDGCESEEAGGEAGIRRIDAIARDLMRLPPGSVVTWDVLVERLPFALRSWYRETCTDCYWLEVCREAGLDEARTEGEGA